MVPLACSPAYVSEIEDDDYWESTVRARTGMADELYRLGARTVLVLETIDLTSAESMYALQLVRDLTAVGMAVNWHLVLPPTVDWVLLSHLYPPATVRTDGAAEVVQAWRERFYVGMLLYRQGPSFLQVRDRRRARLELYTVEAPDYLDAIARSAAGCQTAALSAEVRDELVRDELLLTVGDRSLWLPYRVRRWPRPPMVV
jgi:hypothetical protein